MRAKEVIADNEYVRYKKCGNQYLLYTTSVLSPGNFITKLSDTEYMVNNTREVRQFHPSANNYKDVNLLKRSLVKLRDILMENTLHCNRCVGITLTYADTMRDFEKDNRHFNKFIEKMRRVYGPLEYIVVVQLQKRGVIHFHCVLIFPDKAPFIDNEIVSKKWGHGFTKTEAIQSNKQIANYLSSYNLDLQESVARELFPDDVNDYPTYKEFDDKLRVETIVQGIGIQMIPRTMQVYRHSNNIKLVETNVAIKKDVWADVDSATLEASYIKTCVDEFTGDIINNVRYERYSAKKKGGYKMRSNNSRDNTKETFSDNVMCLLKVFQMKNKVDDQMMSYYLNVNERTYKNYVDHPDNITFKQLDSFLEKNNMSFNELIDSCSIFR